MKIIVCISALLLIGCTATTEAEPDFKRFDFELRDLPHEQRTYGDRGPVVHDWWDHDEDGVLLVKYRGELYYNPTSIAQIGMRWIQNHHLGREDDLQHALIYAEYLKSAAETIDGAYYWSYSIDYALHGDDALTIDAPWYSALAQGSVLMFFVRLYEVTGDESYLEFARGIFPSFSQDTISRVDDGYYWLEEYPTGTQVLNGFAFAVFALHEYFLATGEGERLLQGGLTTIRDHLEMYRNPGGLSYYCLAHKAQSENYHDLHIEMLTRLYLITGDYYFQSMAELFEIDSGTGAQTLRGDDVFQRID